MLKYIREVQGAHYKKAIVRAVIQGESYGEEKDNIKIIKFVEVSETKEGDHPPQNKILEIHGKAIKDENKEGIICILHFKIY